MCCRAISLGLSDDRTTGSGLGVVDWEIVGSLDAGRCDREHCPARGETNMTTATNLAFDYRDQIEDSIRTDLVLAHRRAWDLIASPGTWWTGSERVAMAAETRAADYCSLCRKRREALSPYSEKGDHDSVSSDRHRGAEDRSIDGFHRAMGLLPEPLPEARPGEPTRERPTGAVIDEAWVPMLPNGRLKGDEADLWSGQTGNVIRALSLVPEAVRWLKDLSAAHYLSDVAMTDFTRGRGPLSRAQTELIAGRVSAINECFY